MPYTIYHANGSAVTVNDGQLYNSSFYSGSPPPAAGVGIGLVGQNAVSYGAMIAQNFLQITENFARSGEPPVSIQGQTWFDTTTGFLKVRTGSSGAAVWSTLSFASGSLVTSFNTRTGSITLTSLDVTTALGFTPTAGGVTSVTGTATRISSSGGTTPVIDLITTAVTPGSYTAANITVDAYGRIIAAANGSAGGSGTVTSVSTSTTNGVTASVSTPTTTPTINIGLGNISPDNISITSGNAATTNGTLSITNATAATNKTSGAVIVTGGVGVSGDIWATDIYATGNVTASASDRRLKTNFVTIDNAVEKVQKLTGITYNWDQKVCRDAGFFYPESRQVGVIAQEVQEVLPEAVAPAPGNNEYLTVRYEKIVALLIEAIKEQAAEIAEIKKLLK